MKAQLLRICDSPHGVFGFLDLFNAAGQRVGRFATVEDDFLDNLPSLSCIPAGTYICRRTVYLKHGVPTYEITGVPERSRILFHVGNTEEDSQGCVLLGMDFGAVTVKDEDDPKHWPQLKWSVMQSREAFRQFMSLLDGLDAFTLEVKWASPGEWRIA